MVNKTETWCGFFLPRRGQVARSACLAAAAGGEKLLHDAVFEGVERDHDEASAGLQDALGCGKAQGEFAQLVVDVDPQRLERAGRGVSAVLAPATHDAGNEAGELERRRERSGGAVLADGAGDGAGAFLFAQLEDDVGDRRFVRSVEELGRGWPWRASSTSAMR